MNQGVTQVIDLIDTNTFEIYNFEQFQKIYPQTINFLDYASIIAAIPKQWKNILKNAQEINLSFEVEFPIDTLLGSIKPTAMVYNQHPSSNIIMLLAEKWTSKSLSVFLSEDISTGLNIKRVTKISKYISFQYKLMHSAIFLNDRLYHFRVVETQNCTLCHKQKETYYHLFYECTYARNIWDSLLEKVQSETDIKYRFSFVHMICNSICPQGQHFMNLLALIYKYMLYSYRYSNIKPTAIIIWNEIIFIKQLEKQSIQNNRQLCAFNSRWNTRYTVADISGIYKQNCNLAK